MIESAYKKETKMERKENSQNQTNLVWGYMEKFGSYETRFGFSTAMISNLKMKIQMSMQYSQVKKFIRE